MSPTRSQPSYTSLLINGKVDSCGLDMRHQWMHKPSGRPRPCKGFYRKIPASWIFAQKGMSKLNPKLSLRLMDPSHIIQGDVSITHALNLCQAHGNEVPNGHALRSIMSKGLMKLSDVGLWHKNSNGCLNFISYSQPAPRERWTAIGKDNWRKGG